MLYKRRVSHAAALVSNHTHHVTDIVELHHINLRVRLILKCGPHRVYHHIVDFLSLLFLSDDIRMLALHLHDFLLVQRLLFVKLALGLPQFELQRVYLIQLFLLLLEYLA